MRKPKPSDETEHHIKQQVRKILIQTGWKFWMPSAGIYGRNGVSDFLCVKAPRLFMAIETKYDDVATAPQLAFLKDIHEAGHYAFLVDETNIEELRAVLIHDWLTNKSLLRSFLKWQTQDTPMDIRISKT